jgi:predicted PilT family ATPase
MRSKTYSLLLPSVLIGVFLLTSFIAGRIIYPFWSESRFVPIDKTNAEWVNILVVTPNNAEIIKYGDLAGYLKGHKEYSFTVPNDRIENYHKKLFENFQSANSKSSLNLKIVQLSGNRQSIEIRINGNRRNLITRYETTEKEIFLKAFLTESLFTEFPLLLISIGIGGLFTLFTNLLLKRFLSTPKLK